ncbi:MAG: hypothetical protein LBJ25_00130 [Candidatus Margulisbacteria bacterium]|jgi:hypothetical protein|nr:hypothetical protein [Candidatus Margulisiibacteriota bacterium]
MKQKRKSKYYVITEEDINKALAKSALLTEQEISFLRSSYSYVGGGLTIKQAIFFRSIQRKIKKSESLNGEFWNK